MAESPWLPRGRCGGVLRPGTRQETFPTRRKNKGSGTMVSSSTVGLLKSGSCFVLQNKNPQSNQELLPLKRWSCFTQVLWGFWRQTLAPQKFLVGSVGEEEQPFIGLPSRPLILSFFPRQKHLLTAATNLWFHLQVSDLFGRRHQSTGGDEVVGLPCPGDMHQVIHVRGSGAPYPIPHRPSRAKALAVLGSAEIAGEFAGPGSPAAEFPGPGTGAEHIMDPGERIPPPRVQRAPSPDAAPRLLSSLLIAPRDPREPRREPLC